MLYRTTCAVAWDGDAFGNEWKCGAAVHECDGRFDVYEDDGAGNGNLLASFKDEGAARKYADLYVAFLDAGGYGDSPEAAEMATHSLQLAIND